MSKKSSIKVLIIFILGAIFLGILFLNKGDGPVMGMILSVKPIENTKEYATNQETHVDGIYLVVSNAFNKFEENYKTAIPKNTDIYATIYLVECPKGSEYEAKWMRDGQLIKEDKKILLTDAKGVISYMLEGQNTVKGGYVFELYNSEKKIFEYTFSIE